MKPTQSLNSILFALFLTSLAAAGQRSHDEIMLAKNVNLHGADSAEARIEMLIGELRLISADIPQLANARCFYNRKQWEPAISYEVEQGKGALLVSNREQKDGLDFDDDDNTTWNFIVNDAVPITYEVFLGAGDCDIRLNDSHVKRFSFEMKAGDADISLQGTDVRQVDLRALAGDVTLDLSGERKHDLEATLRGGVGELTLILPRECRIAISVSGMLGSIDAWDFRKEGRDYFYAPDQYKNTLIIEIRGGIGDIRVILA